ncbi:lysophospholipid acyltransferase family protein [Tellurirhabdus bombi]|uniref:lysophospholipid acyltransferase family protein n=1 Tax=Tellurirhabdus bombi TaxID=2907205 RepID=UPI001F21F69C|nr:lysophospholipid acyltransferase family protein [Tellurirhabdus bombi]
MNTKPPTRYSLLPRFLMPLDFLGLFEQDPFGNFLFLKRILMSIVGWITYFRYTLYNRVRIEGMEHLKDLPINNVLFLSNHQTYFADVIAFYHIFCAAKWGYKNTIIPPFYLLAPRARSYYVAASETMKGGFIPRMFSMGGAIQVERSWRSKGQDVNREVDKSAGNRIGMALDHGWVVSFPQGTTSPYAPVRKGTAHILKEDAPIVVPIVINGFRRAFDKKGLRLKKQNTVLSVRIKPPLAYSPDESIDDLVDKVRSAIEQDIPKEKLTWLM